MAGRVGVRNTLAAFISNPQIANLNQVFTSFPKRINYQVNSQPGQLTRSAVIVFIASETESRLAIGGAHSGWKRIDYTLILQVYTHSMQRNAEDVMNDFDVLIDNIKARLRSDHNFGDPTGNLVWQGAEPVISARYGEVSTTNEGASEVFAEIEFLVTEMIQA
jgi:hypothetical protein